MGSFLCLCDKEISDIRGSDGEIFKEDNCDEGQYEAGEGLCIWECSICGTLCVDDSKKPNYILFYKPDTGIFNKLLKEK